MQNIKHYIEVMFYKAYAELRAEGSRAYIGFLWWVAEPALFLGVFYLAFDTGLKRGGVGIAPFLLTGLIPWKWFSSTIISSASAIGRNGGLMQQVYLPKVILPGITVIFNTIKFLIVLVILMVFLLTIFHKPISITWLALPIIILVQFVLIAGLAMFIAAIVPILPDLKLLLDNLITMLFFVSGVFFDISHAHGTVHEILMLNPMAVVLQCYRAVLLNGTWPSFESLGWVSLTSLLLLTGGIALILRFDRVYPKLVT